MKRMLWLIMFVSAAARAQQAPVAQPSVALQRVSLGDAQIQADKPAVLVLPREALEQLGAALAGLIPSLKSAPGTILLTDSTLVLLWRAPGVLERRIVVQEPTVLMPIVPQSSATYQYALEASDPRNRFKVRLPADGQYYRVEVEVPQGPIVVEGPGDLEGTFGETVPVKIRLAARAGIKSAVVHHRSTSTSPWATAPMRLESGQEQEGRWAASLVRPLGKEVTIEYHIVADDLLGHTTRYGLPDKPYRLKILAPDGTVPGQGEQ
ncbi:MAG: hypothetical protein HY815_11980 [Candidatus Riflebacteria bacterium]|nr:hypothetical protein [Candidatus Riflebacteria bacterium]